jgi:hypothetical protein
MLLIATIHLCWLLLAPIGFALLIAGLMLKKRGVSAFAVVALIASFPALYLCTVFFPLDFILPPRQTRLPVGTRVHFPDSDFYTTGFEVRRAAGKIARVLIDGDDSKWWNPHTVTGADRTYFVRGGETPTSRTPSIDLADSALVPGYTGPDGNPYKIRIEDLNF